jgi:geranylgeranyl diphosphate synthase type II
LPIALNVGDAVFVLAIRPLMDNIAELGGVLAWLVFSEIEHMVRQSVEGQAIELGWIHENTLDLTPDDYLRMCLKKTCWYTTIHPCRIGALIGGKGHVPPAHFNQFAYFMGASFKITDELLNLIGEYSQYGKEPRGDLFEGKRTMALIHLFSSASKREKTWLAEFLSTPRAQRTNADVRHVYGLMERHGSIEFSRSRARFLAGAALAEYDKVFGDLPGSADKSFIRDIVHYMIERNI